MSRSNPLRLFCRAPRIRMWDFMTLKVLEVLEVLKVLEGVPLEHLEHVEHLEHLWLVRPSPSEYQPSDNQKHRRAHRRDSYRAEVQRALGDAAPSEEGAEPSSNERAGDAERDRDEAAGGIASRNEECREPASEETGQDPVEPERQCEWGW